MALYGGGLDPRKAGPRRRRLTQTPVAGVPKAPGTPNRQQGGADRDSLKALYMQKKRSSGPRRHKLTQKPAGPYR